MNSEIDENLHFQQQYGCKTNDLIKRRSSYQNKLDVEERNTEIANVPAKFKEL